jgi:hypothetical protein
MTGLVPAIHVYLFGPPAFAASRFYDGFLITGADI